MTTTMTAPVHAVIQAIIARDGKQAMRAMDEHIRTAWQEILAAIGGEPAS